MGKDICCVNVRVSKVIFCTDDVMSRQSQSLWLIKFCFFVVKLVETLDVLEEYVRKIFSDVPHK